MNSIDIYEEVKQVYERVTGLPWVEKGAPPRMPTRVQIGPFGFAVRAVNIEELSAPDQYGNVTYKDQTIRVRQWLHVDAARETLIHEILHAIYRTVGQSDRTMDEESVATMLSPLLLDALRRNPALVAYLTAEDA